MFGDSFDDLIFKDKKGNVRPRDVKNLIKQYYDFHGYLSFANSVQKLIDNAIGNRKLTAKEKQKEKEKTIDENFSHRVLIIDELHNLRDETDNKGKDKKFKKGEKVYDKVRGIDVTVMGRDKKKIVVKDDNENETPVHEKDLVPILIDKKLKDIIEDVIKYSKGLRLIMLSATPMFNKSTEIIWLLNLLLQNDNRDPIKKSDVFDKNDILTEEGEDILKEKSRGYFSYLRGENPLSFPIRLYPDINGDENCIANRSKYPSQSFNGSELRADDVFDFMKMYGSKMSGFQEKIYEDFKSKIVDEGDEGDGGISLSDRGIDQISNIVFTMKIWMKVI